MGQNRIPSPLDPSLRGGGDQPRTPTALTRASLHHSPVAPMEDFGTLKEQHREQKLFPQLLQLRCRQKPKPGSDASPARRTCRPPSTLLFPPAGPTQGTWDYWGTEVTQRDTLQETYPLLQH